MLKDAAGIKLNIEIHHPSYESPVVFMLHGFTGSGEDWNEIISFIGNKFTYVTVDMIGHGRSNSPAEVDYYRAEAISNQLYELIKMFDGRKIAIVGYSMGGRAALTFAAVFPEMLNALVLESATPGLTDDVARLERRKTDEKLAAFIESHSIGEFVDKWMNQDLFKSQKKLKKEKLERLRQLKMKNNPTGLANTLRGFSTGVMPPLYDRLDQIKCPVLLITGELDEKFSETNRKISHMFPIAEHVVIGNAGHNVHLERPKEFSMAVKDFLINSLFKEP
ncbi:MAG: 2-succinyl-6-hydroxy-2,4-cyclohexadiene-1-carboxylate synthase [Candidatus Kryptoniota bacterium]